MDCIRFAAVALSALVLAPSAQAEPRGRADLSRLVVVGDSLSAGYQNGSLLARQQAHGYAAVMAGQARAALPLPLIAEPGVPAVLTLVDPGPPPLIVPAPGVSPGRLDPLTQPMNLAVPGHAVAEALRARPPCTFAPDPATIFTDLVLGLPGCLVPAAMSQVEWAEALAPTTILVWIGNMDALRAAIVADSGALTPGAAFDADYTELLARLAATGATLVVANIPDVTVIPFLTPAEGIADLVGLPLTLVGPALGIAAGDFVTPDAYPLIEPILLNPALGPLPPGVVLTAAEVTAIRAATAQYNAIIAAQAEARGAALVDVRGLLEDVRARGRVVQGGRLTTGFLGGLFSLDGVHPTDTGYAVLANAFIDTLNAAFAAGIPPADLLHVQLGDPLVLPGAGHPASALPQVSAETAIVLRRHLVP